MPIRWKLGPIGYTPFRERLEGTDQHNLVQPIPRVSDNFQTYWFGNQLPPSRTTIIPHAAYVKVRSQYDRMPQFNQNATFGRQLGTVDTAVFTARMHQLWTLAKARYNG